MKDDFFKILQYLGIKCAIIWRKYENCVSETADQSSEIDKNAALTIRN